MTGLLKMGLRSPGGLLSLTLRKGLPEVWSSSSSSSWGTSTGSTGSAGWGGGGWVTIWAADSVLATKLSMSTSPAMRPFSAMFSNSPTGLTLGMNLRVKMLLRVLGMLRMAPLMARGGSDKFSRGRAIRRTPNLVLSPVPPLFSASLASSGCNTERLSSRASAISGLRIFLRLGLAKSSKILANWSGSMESSLDEEELLPPEDGTLVRV